MPAPPLEPPTAQELQPELPEPPVPQVPLPTPPMQPADPPSRATTEEPDVEAPASKRESTGSARRWRPRAEQPGWMDTSTR